VVHIEVFVGFVIYVEIEGREVGGGSGGYQHRVGREEFKFFTFEIVVVLRSAWSWFSCVETHLFEGNVWVFVVITVEG
jgi:hypothetical protein